MYEVCSEHSNDIELVVVLVQPEASVREVRVVQELATALRPTHWFSLRVTVDHGRI